MKKRWICLYVENEIGVLARISGLFASKSYNVDSLTVGTTEDSTISRMTISVTSDDKTFEQIIKQLNRSVEVIKVVDYTDIPIYLKELMFVKINCIKEADREEAFRIAKVFNVTVADYSPKYILLQCVQTGARNNDLIQLLQKCFVNRLEIVRGGSVGIEAVSKHFN